MLFDYLKQLSLLRIKQHLMDKLIVDAFSQDPHGILDVVVAARLQHLTELEVGELLVLHVDKVLQCPLFDGIDLGLRLLRVCLRLEAHQSFQSDSERLDLVYDALCSLVLLEDLLTKLGLTQRMSSTFLGLGGRHLLSFLGLLIHAFESCQLLLAEHRLYGSLSLPEILSGHLRYRGHVLFVNLIISLGTSRQIKVLFDLYRLLYDLKRVQFLHSWKAILLLLILLCGHLKCEKGLLLWPLVILQELSPAVDDISFHL